jgi:hypothetical protein
MKAFEIMLDGKVVRLSIRRLSLTMVMDFFSPSLIPRNIQIFSKLELGRMPNVAEIIKAVESAGLHRGR